MLSHLLLVCSVIVLTDVVVLFIQPPVGDMVLLEGSHINITCSVQGPKHVSVLWTPNTASLITSTQVCKHYCVLIVNTSFLHNPLRMANTASLITSTQVCKHYCVLIVNTSFLHNPLSIMAVVWWLVCYSSVQSQLSTMECSCVLPSIPLLMPTPLALLKSMSLVKHCTIQLLHITSLFPLSNCSFSAATSCHNRVARKWRPTCSLAATSSNRDQVTFIGLQA